MKLMIVDDEEDVKFLYEQKFRRERRKGEVELEFAFSASEAIKHLEQNGTSDITLVLSDINMPGVSGLELLRILKDKYDPIKVFMVTAYEDSDNYNKAMEYGAADYLTKPIDFDSLKERIMKLV